jgi:hypothetical protein
MVAVAPPPVRVPVKVPESAETLTVPAEEETTVAVPPPVAVTVSPLV